MSETAFHRLPWQEGAWDRLWQARRQQRLPHALLFTGPMGVGKSAFALALAQSLICESPGGQGEACGQCRHCHLFRAGTHPDFRRVEPEEDSNSGEIKIEIIRRLAEKSVMTASGRGHKVVIVRPADRMNSAAANSLLKTLEEPTAGTLLMLLTDHPSRLLPTIRSRCQNLVFSPPARDEALQWLQGRVNDGDPGLLLDLAGGAPFKAMAMDRREILLSRLEMLTAFLSLGKNQADPVKLAENWSKHDIKQLLEWLTGWIIDMLRLQVGCESPQLFNRDQRSTLQNTAKRLNSILLHRFLARVYEIGNLTDANLNPQLMLEKLLIEWNACLRQAKR